MTGAVVLEKIMKPIEFKLVYHGAKQSKHLSPVGIGSNVSDC